jgi:hypothetical protein
VETFRLDVQPEVERTDGAILSHCACKRFQIVRCAKRQHAQTAIAAESLRRDP